MRISYDELYQALRRALLKVGFEQGRADLCARLFADTDRDGVYTHGLNRFPRFLEMIERGAVDVGARAVCAEARGAFERWEGNRGAGNLNAHDSMARAVELSRSHGLGCVALRNTNHWMRGGSYGWQAAEAGALAACWTNTMPNLPPWGSARSLLGNNPLVLAVPRAAGHVVLDMAMSQFSYGALAAYRERGEQLPVDGGFDAEGRLTRDPRAVEESGRPLPVGYWKGSGLALLLDMAAALLSGGLATHQIPADPLEETGVSQVFIAFDLSTLSGSRVADEIVDNLKQRAVECDRRMARQVRTTRGSGWTFQYPAAPSDDDPPATAGGSDLDGGRARLNDAVKQTSADGEAVRYPGERTLKVRRENTEQGIPVEPLVWRQLQEV